MSYFNTVGVWIPDPYLSHYGTPMHSGRYPYGSGERPYQANGGISGLDTDVKKRMKTFDYYGAAWKYDRWGKVSPKKELEKHPIEKISELKRFDVSDEQAVLNARSNINADHGSYNCQNCSLAFELTERGYDVTARLKRNGSNVGTGISLEKAFKNGKFSGSEAIVSSASGFDELNKLKSEYEKYSNQTGALRTLNKGKRRQASFEYAKKRNEIYDNIINSIEKELKKPGDGSRGIIVVGWSDSYDLLSTQRRAKSFHAFNYKEENGELKYYDCQSSNHSKQNGDVGNDFYQDCNLRDIYYMRTDNLELNEYITKAVYSRR